MFLKTKACHHPHFREDKLQGELKLKTNHGFLFPFVMFFTLASMLTVLGFTSLLNISSSYQEILSMESQAKRITDEQVNSFKKVLQITNSNGGLDTSTGADNDNYSRIGSGATGLDDDEDAFMYKIGFLKPAETKNILFIDPTYLQYSNGFLLTDLRYLNLNLSFSGQATVYKLDNALNIYNSISQNLNQGYNTIDISSLNTGNSLALFLKNNSTGSILDYSLTGSGSAGQSFLNFIPAKNLGAGKYIYYSNLLLQDSSNKFIKFGRMFNN